MLMVRERVDPVAARLRDLEKALYGTEHGAGTLMADRLGISVQRWHNAKSGRGLSDDVKIRIVQRIPGMTTDWLLFGERRGLSYEMAERLDLFWEGNHDTKRRR